MAEYIEKQAALDAILREPPDAHYPSWYAERIKALPAADVVSVVHGRCPICSGRKILTQDCDNGYSVEVDAEFGEMSIWQGDTCLTVISIDYCPNCGAKMDGGEANA